MNNKNKIKNMNREDLRKLESLVKISSTFSDKTLSDYFRKYVPSLIIEYKLLKDSPENINKDRLINKIDSKDEELKQLKSDINFLTKQIEKLQNDLKLKDDYISILRESYNKKIESLTKTEIREF